MPVSTVLLIVGALLTLALVVGFVLRMLDGRRRPGGQLQFDTADLGSSVLAPGATLVQFSTEFCTRCPQVRRLLGEIADSRAGVDHIEIDLTNRNDLASKYHVLQTPTTFLVDASGSVLSRWGGVPDKRTVNNALASTVPTFIPQEQR